jgi:dTDP-4-dehydrorhamnose reductase
VLKVDLTSFPAVTKALEAFQPDILVHAAAERHPDVIEVRRVPRSVIKNTKYALRVANRRAADRSARGW